MKTWLIPLTIVALMIAGATAGAFASGGGDGDSAAEKAGAAHYEVLVRFNTSVEQGDIDATSDLLRAYDPSLDFMIQESWPPTGVAYLQTDTLNFCDTITNELSSPSYIEDISCGPQQVLDSDVEDLPPVSSDALTEPADCSLANDVDGCDDGVDSDCEPVPLRSDCGIDPDVCNQVHNIDACDQDDLDRLDVYFLPPLNTDADTDTSCEPVPLRSDCGIDPNECNKVHNITACSGPSEEGVGPIVMPADGTAVYEVVVRYNTSVTQPDMDETAGFLRGFDAGLEFMIQESWPPTGVASLQTDTSNFCDAIFDELASQSYITDFSCGPQEKLNDVNGDVPVVNVNDLP